jgi:hypothetical protein
MNPYSLIFNKIFRDQINFYKSIINPKKKKNFLFPKIININLNINLKFEGNYY